MFSGRLPGRLPGRIARPSLSSPAPPSTPLEAPGTSPSREDTGHTLHIEHISVSPLPYPYIYIEYSYLLIHIYYNTV